jgi:hypothetical protein
MLKRFLPAAAVVGGLSALVGCVDPRGNFDDFNGRVGTTDASTVDRPSSSIFNITGDFLLSVRAGFETTNDPTFYIQFVTTFTLTPTGETAVVDGSYLPLCTSSACGGVRSMVPPPLVDNQRAVANDGSFQQPVVGTLNGMANPFSGTEQPLDGLLDATIISADLICGGVTGTAAGINLAGSTFAAIRITDTTAANLPAPLAACPNPQPVDAGVDAVEIDAPPI